MCVSESSVLYSESCECDFVTLQGLVGGGPREWDFFEMCEYVVMLRFQRVHHAQWMYFLILWKWSNRMLRLTRELKEGRVPV